LVGYCSPREVGWTAADWHEQRQVSMPSFIVPSVFDTTVAPAVATTVSPVASEPDRDSGPKQR
jgi:hypothetical protein